jgi:hypothetical protein
MITGVVFELLPLNGHGFNNGPWRHVAAMIGGNKDISALFCGAFCAFFGGPWRRVNSMCISN